MKTTILAVLSATLLGAGCSMFHGSDRHALQGRWEGGVTHGDPETPCTFVISGNQFEFRDLAHTNVWYQGTFTLQENTTPHRFIAAVKACPFPQYVGTTSMAIYRIDHGVLTIAGNEPGGPTPPAAFDAPGSVCMTLKKK